MSACTLCETGKFQNATGRTVCQSCVEGQFQALTGRTNCSLCARGSYQDVYEQTACALCFPGTYQNRTAQSLCLACAPGSVASSAGAVLCSVCSAGKVQPLSGQTACSTCGAGQQQPRTNATACDNCPAGSFNGWNASQWDAAGQAPNCSLCPPGAYGSTTGLTACLQCEENSFQNASGCTSCASCAAGLFSGPGQTICSNCTAGSYLNASVGCSDCETGKFQPGRGRTTCAACPTGRYTEQTGGRTLESCLLCPAGSVSPTEGASACVDCAPGTYQTGEGTTVCSKCSSGSYTSISGANLGCLGCGAGLYQGSNGSTVCLECTPCGENRYRWSGCNGTHDALCQNCSLCSPGEETVRACTLTSDTVCGSPGQCWANRTDTMRVPPWLASRREYQCSAGQYLLALSAVVGGGGVGAVKQCVRCPLGWVGLNGVYCERCGELQEPYYVDGSSCVCRAPAVMNATGGCQCPDGYGLGSDGACAPCGRDTYGLGGRCFACGAGNTTPGTGATACEACAAGLFRPSGASHVGAGCRNCSRTGWFAPDPTDSACVECNQTCAATGWRWKGFCPGETSSMNHSECEPCPGLPANATWSNITVDPVAPYKALEECSYSCNPGFYLNNSAGCAPCNTSRVCDPGWRLTACSAWSDSHCDVQCIDDHKPLLYSHWESSSSIECAWACDEGRTLAVTDYVIFTLRECV